MHEPRDTSTIVWRWALASVLFSLILATSKWAAYASTHSTAILSDAVESFVNILSSSFVVYAIWLSNLPRDDEHPYGHGKVEYFSAGFEGALVLFAAVSIGALGVIRLLEPVEVTNLGVGMVAQAIISLVTIAMGQALIHAGKSHESPALKADGVHFRSDAITSVAVVAGLGITALTGAVWVDAAFAILVAVGLAVNGVHVVREAVGGLMDEADPELLGRVASALEEVREPGWIAPHHTKIHRLGRGLHIDLHMVFPSYWTVEASHVASQHIDARLAQEFGSRTEVMVHMESCMPEGCSYCDIEACPIRSADFVRRHTWDASHISRRFRHSDLEPGADDA